LLLDKHTRHQTSSPQPQEPIQKGKKPLDKAITEAQATRNKTINPPHGTDEPDSPAHTPNPTSTRSPLGWSSIDCHERSLGEPAGRPRVKLTTIEQLLEAAACDS
jgi:hypothetical protein